MVLQSMHECMHAARFCSAFIFWHFSLVKSPRVLLLLRWFFAAIEMVFTLFYCATSGAVQSTVRFVKYNFDKRVPVAHEGLACGLDAA